MNKMGKSKLRTRNIISYLNWRYSTAVFLLVGAFLILYNEVLIYLIYNLRWLDLRCESSNSSHCLRIMLVSDPRILGNANSNFLERWDTDRYLKMTYKSAKFHFSPNVIIYLGDLMDEGAIASKDDFFQYYRRLNDIFTLRYPVTSIFVHGDTDIGKTSTPETQANAYRFHKYITQNQTDTIWTHDDSVVFYKIDRILNTFPKPVSIPVLPIAVSHLPLLHSSSKFIDYAIDIIRPQLVFSGHVGENMVIDALYVTDEDRKTVSMDAGHNSIFRVTLNPERIFEFVVPTCAYWGGVNHMGFGGAVLDLNKKTLDYTIFWLPPRNESLWLYYAFLWTVLSSLPVIALLPKYYLSIKGIYTSFWDRVILNKFFYKPKLTDRKPV